MAQPLPARLWCFHCCHEWDTPDSHQTQCCPKCLTTPRRIYTVGSTLHAYAFMEKERILNPPVELDLREVLHSPYAVQDDQARELAAAIVPLVQAGKTVRLLCHRLHALKYGVVRAAIGLIYDAVPGAHLEWADIVRVPAWQQLLNEAMRDYFAHKKAA